jgi:DNA invertase Pin-like site-specific DNA recombinase
MMVNYQKPDFDQIVRHCRKIAAQFIKDWKPVNAAWPIETGGIYIRLSSEQQVRVEKGSLEQQIYIAFLELESRSRQETKNYRATHVYIEAGVSGGTDNRPEFQVMSRDIRQGKHKFIAAKELSRFFRDVLLWKLFFRLCQEKGVKVVIKGLPIDPNDPAQLLQLDIIAAFAEYERRQTSKRIRESVFSAMLNNGKFNSTHQVLGFDPLQISGERKVGFYTPNDSELANVRWIMEQFLKYGSYLRVIQECEQKGVRSKNGKPFKRHSLVNLLTNTRYVGKWYLNEENKGNASDDLPMDQRYAEIDLPHGSVIEADLWNLVQAKVAAIAGNLGMNKNTRVNRVYPLSAGLLVYEDGSTFRGFSGTGNTCTSHYYRCDKHGLNIRADLIEQHTIKIVADIIKNTPEVQVALKEAGQQVQDNLQFWHGRIGELKAELASVESELAVSRGNLSKLLRVCDTDDEAREAKNEFRATTDALKARHQTLLEQVRDAELALLEQSEHSFSWRLISDHASRVQDRMLERDPVSLKNAYRKLFRQIRVGPEDDMGMRTITYVPTLTGEDEVCLKYKMVEAEGVEPSSADHPN